MRSLLLIVFLAGVLALAHWLSETRPQPAARVLEADIGWEMLTKERSPVEVFASIVDERAGSELARRLEIDTSNEAARNYMMRIAPELFSAERVSRDQAVAARIADALEMVLVQGISEEEAYAVLALEDVMGEPRWEEYIMASEVDHISTLRTFAEADAPMETSEIDEQVMSAYLIRLIRDEICSLPEPYNNIRQRILDKVGGDVTDPLLKDVSVFEAECTLEQRRYLNEFLADAVVVYRTELQDYSRYLVVLGGANQISQ